MGECHEESALVAHFNASPNDPDARRLILMDIFESIGPHIYIEGPFSCSGGKNISIADWFYANFDCCFNPKGPVTFGTYICVAPAVTVGPKEGEKDTETDQTRPIKVGHRVWIGGLCHIKPGADIGDDCVIGAGSVVDSVIPPKCLAAGNPAKVIRYFDSGDVWPSVSLPTEAALQLIDQKEKNAASEDQSMSPTSTEASPQVAKFGVSQTHTIAGDENSISMQTPGAKLGLRKGQCPIVDAELSEFQKMIKGYAYSPYPDPELVKLRADARILTSKINATDGVTDFTQRNQWVRELFGKAGKDICVRPPFRCDYGCNIKCGDNFYANFGCIILDCAEVLMGDNVMFGPNVHIYTATHPLDAEQRSKGIEGALPIKMGDNVWIGGGSIVLPGVTVGNNVVIGAGSVVTKDCRSDSVYAGNPARFIREITDADKWEHQEIAWSSGFVHCVRRF